jgi:tellurium resistance protein TerD
MTVINLQKAQTGVRIDLTKALPGLDKVKAVLSWGKSPAMTEAIDLDLSAIMLDENDKMLCAEDLLFYNTETVNSDGKKIIAEGAIMHSGDVLDGGTDGLSVEEIVAKLSTVPKAKIAFFISIDEKEGQTGLNLGQAVNAQISIVDDASGEKLVEYDLTEDYSQFKFMRVFEIYKKNDAWKFHPQGQGSNEDLGDLLHSFGFQTNP